MNEKDLTWLRQHAKSERDALTVYYLEAGLPMAEIGEKAGFSGGQNPDPAKKKACFAAAASRASASRRIQTLREQYRSYKAHGDKPVAGEAEVLQRLSQVMRTSNDSSVISAARSILEHHRRHAPRQVPDDQLANLVNACCSPKRNILLQVFGLGAGLGWKSGGMRGMQSWEPPEHLKRVESLMNRHGLSPAEVMALLTGTG